MPDANADGKEQAPNNNGEAASSNGSGGSPDIATLVSTIEELKSSMVKQEENAAWMRRELEKAAERDKERKDLLEEKAAKGDKEAKTRLAQEEREELDGKITTFQTKAEKLEQRLKQTEAVNPIYDKIASKISDSAFAKRAIKEAISKHAKVDGEIDNLTVKYVNDKGDEFSSEADFVAYLEKEMPELFKSTRASGVNEKGEKTSATGAKGGVAHIDPHYFAKLSKAQQREKLDEMELEDKKRLFNELRANGYN